MITYNLFCSNRPLSYTEHRESFDILHFGVYRNYVKKQYVRGWRSTHEHTKWADGKGGDLSGYATEPKFRDACYIHAGAEPSINERQSQERFRVVKGRERRPGQRGEKSFSIPSRLSHTSVRLIRATASSPAFSNRSSPSGPLRLEIFVRSTFVSSFPSRGEHGRVCRGKPRELVPDR